VQRASGSMPDAEKSFLKAIELDPKRAEFHFNLAAVYRRQQKVKESIAEYEKAIALDPNLAPAHYDLGVMYKNEKRTEDAVREWNRYLELIASKDPKEAEGTRKHILELGGKPAR